jgi:hypothetical protein
MRHGSRSETKTRYRLGKGPNETPPTLCRVTGRDRLRTNNFAAKAAVGYDEMPSFPSPAGLDQFLMRTGTALLYLWYLTTDY